ncbi:MAG: DUF434 domain-containing protein [Planctomycetota bacterium]|nr:MAG: DUF434 domain-containing protein [Planctomycetota bacterium]
MPDKRKHRGPHPDDAGLFAAKNTGVLGAAVADYSMLLSAGYAPKSSLKLVGDHFALTERQRLAIMRSACSDDQLAGRSAKQTDVGELKGRPIVIDGYNLLITIESALSGAAIFIGRDRCMRDLSGIHGSYRKVTETIPAIELIASQLVNLGVAHALWLFDSPVSNSGRLKTLMYELIEKNDWPFDVELLTNPDNELVATEKTIATSDSNILDNCNQWTNLAACIIQTEIQKGNIEVNLIDLSPSQ